MRLWLTAAALALLTNANAGVPCADCDKDLAAALTRQAMIYRGMGRDELAEHYHRQALAAAQAAHGQSHPEVAACLNNLAELYRAQGRTRQAEPLYRRATRMLSQTLGPEDPAVATVMHNLGDLYTLAGRYGDADMAYRKALAIKEKHPGQELRLAATLNNLGELRRRQGRPGAALALFSRALAIWQRELGDDHPYTQLARHNLELTETTDVNERWSVIRRNAPGPWGDATRSPAPSESPSP